MASNKKINPVAVPVEGKVVYVSFKIKNVFIPGKGRFDTEILMEKERALSEEYMAENAKAKPNSKTLLQLEQQMVLPRLVAEYLDTGTKSDAMEIVMDAKKTRQPKKKQDPESPKT